VKLKLARALGTGVGALLLAAVPLMPAYAWGWDSHVHLSGTATCNIGDLSGVTGLSLWSPVGGNRPVALWRQSLYSSGYSTDFYGVPVGGTYVNYTLYCGTQHHSGQFRIGRNWVGANNAVVNIHD
jgi:hypothetical protein